MNQLAPSDKFTFVVPGDLETPTGGYIYDRRIITALSETGHDVSVCNLGSGYPNVDRDRLNAARDLLQAQPSDRTLIIDGLAFGAMAPIASDLADTHRIIALVHHPLALETGLSAENAEILRLSETEALTHTSHIIVTSWRTRQTLMQDYAPGGADLSSKISVVTPGFDRPHGACLEKNCSTNFDKIRHLGPTGPPHPLVDDTGPPHPLDDGTGPPDPRDDTGASRAHADRTDPTRLLDGGTSPFRLLAVGTITPRKGFDVLIDALARLDPNLDWHLTVAGNDQADPATTSALVGQIADHDLQEHVTLLGALAQSTLQECYRTHDVFVLASHYEGYGMAYAEAVLNHLPVIGTTGGAIPDTVPPACGILVPPGDPAAFAEAIERVLTDPAKRASMVDACVVESERLPTWTEAGRRFADVLKAVT